MATISAEQAIARFQDLEEQVNSLLARATASERAHADAHAELESLRASNGGKGESLLIDPKSMVPEKLGAVDCD